MDELELLREMDKRTLQVQRAAEDLVQAAIRVSGRAYDADGTLHGKGYWVPLEELEELRKALKVVHDYALEVATGREGGAEK